MSAVLVVTFVLLAASTGISPRSFADYNHNPIGVANSCTLSGSTTYIYGWAHDPDAGAGGQPKVVVQVGTQSQTVVTDVANYHEATINKYLADARSAIPTGTNYGFVAKFTGLYKGTAYNISGTVLNYGSGTADPVLKVDTSSVNIDGINVATVFTAAKTIPDACLQARPVIPAPTPVQTPTPTPTPVKPTGGTKTTGSTTTPAAPAADAATTGKADGSVAAGTISATITVPADGAESAYVLYGTGPSEMSDSTDDGTFSNDKTSLVLVGLQSKTKYYYQIVRTTSAGVITTSPVADFTTTGYAITLHFIDAKKKPVAGIQGVLSDSDATSAKSDANGDLKFYDLDTGTYTVKYAYNKLSYSKDFDTDNAADDEDSAGKTAVLSDTINVSALKNGSTKALPTKKHSPVGTIFLILLVLIVLGVVVWLLIRRRRAAQAGAAYGHNYNAGVIDTPTPVHTAVPRPKKTAPVPDEQLEHVGESLREMVVRSMHEEAQKRKQDQ